MSTISTADSSASRWSRLRAAWAGVRGREATALLTVTVLYTVFTLIVTYPVAWNLGVGIAGQAGDTFQHLWSLWWGEKALLELQVPFSDVSMLYFPQEVDHALLNVTPWIQVVAAPFVALFGPIVAYNIWHLLSTILTGVTTYLLAYEISGDRRAAFVGGLIFAFAPTRLIHGIGHYAQIMTYLFPLFFLFLVRLLKKPTLKNAAYAGITLTLSMLVNFVHVAYFIIPATLLLVGHYAWTQRPEFLRRQRLLGLVLAAGIGVLLTAPFFLPFLSSGGSGGLGYLQSAGVSLYGVDLLAFITPSSLHPLLREFPAIRQAFHRVVAIGYEGQNVTEGLVYLGIIPLLLGWWGTRRRKEAARPWLVLLLVTAVLSLGPFLRFNGDLVTYEVDGRLSYLVMPYALLTRLPLYELARTPGRINATTMMALAVLVSLGVAALLARWRAHPGRQALFLALLVPVILLEYLTVWPYPMAPEPVPEFYEEVAAETGEFGILETPMYLIGYQEVHSFDFPMYYQLVHERPIAGGYIWRLPPEAGGTMRALDNLVSPEPAADIVPLPPMEERVSLLGRLGFRYVVVHKYDTQLRRRPMPEEQLAQTVAYLGDLLGPPVYDDRYIVAFRVPDGAAPTAGEGLFLTLGENWLSRQVEDDRVWRWSTNRRSGLVVYGQSDTAQRLSFQASSVDGPRHVTLAVNGEAFGQIVVDESRPYLTPPFTLPREQNEIMLSLEEACRPLDPGAEAGPENPCRNLRVSDVRLVPEQAQWGENDVSCGFSNGIELLGYDLAQAAPGNLQLTLYWQATAPVADSYTVFTHLRDEAGHIYAQQDNQPMGGLAPTAWWATGEIVVDEYALPLPDSLPPEGNLLLTTGLYSWPGGRRLEIASDCPTASPEQHVTLTAINVEETP